MLALGVFAVGLGRQAATFLSSLEAASEQRKTGNRGQVKRVHLHALFDYNQKESFGRVDFDLEAEDPTVRYTIINIDGKPIHSLTVKRSELQFE